jgi:hypothetical protein
MSLSEIEILAAKKIKKTHVKTVSIEDLEKQAKERGLPVYKVLDEMVFNLTINHN